jgi:hypothetical protein
VLGDFGGLDVALGGPVEPDEADKAKGAAFPGDLLPLGAATNQIGVGYQSAQATVTLHNGFCPVLAHH